MLLIGVNGYIVGQLSLFAPLVNALAADRIIYGRLAAAGASRAFDESRSTISQSKYPITEPGINRIILLANKGLIRVTEPDNRFTTYQSGTRQL